MTSGVDQVEFVKAHPLDIDSLKRIADQHKNELGFVRKPSLLKSIDKSQVILVRIDGKVVGFVEYHHRKDQQTTIYNIVIENEYRRQGFGEQLVELVAAEAQKLGKKIIYLKCPEELEANTFYQRTGFRLEELQQGKHRALKVWHKPID